MNGSKFDRLTRTLAQGVSRRGLLATTGGLAIGKWQVGLAAQLTPSTCAAAGEVCTLTRGCCDALTCVTSAINTNYGVCVPGEGGTVAVGTTLISPFAEGVEQEVAAMAAAATTDATSTTSTTTDVEAEREARQDEKKARQEDRRDDRKLRKETNQDEQKDRREDQRAARELRRGPRLELELFNAGSTNPVETVRITNRADEDVVLNAIESLPPPGTGTDLSSNGFRLGPGESVLFLSELPSATQQSIEGNRIRWTSGPVCSGNLPEDGFVIKAAFSSDLDNHDYVIFCDGSDDGALGNNLRRDRRRRKSRRGGKGRKSRNKNG